MALMKGEEKVTRILPVVSLAERAYDGRGESRLSKGDVRQEEAREGQREQQDDVRAVRQVAADDRASTRGHGSSEL